MYGRILFSCCVVSKCSVRYFNSKSTKQLLKFLAAMPKANTSRITDAQKQRHNITKKSEKYSASHVYLQVIGSGARGAPNTLYLFTDQKRYLFNCGECTQRLAHEHKVKLSRLNDIFITSKTWKNIGGLPGLSLTLQDVGVPNITLHGPEGLDELYSATKRFVIMKEMNIKMAKCSPSEDFEDNVMTVKYVLLSPNDNVLNCQNIKQSTKKLRPEILVEKDYEEYFNDDTDYYKHESKVQRFTKHNPNATKVHEMRRSPDHDSMKKKTDKAANDFSKMSHCSVAYICTLRKRLGTLDLAKCVEKGVKPGPLLGQLKAGQNVVLPDGTLVLASDVKTPDDPGPVFIVLEVPEISYLKEEEFRAHFDNDENAKESVPSVIVHYTPPHVLNHHKYKIFMAMFGPSCQHLVLNSQNACLGSEAVHRTQHKLHLLDPDIFPLLKDVSLPAVWSAQSAVKTDSPVMMKGLEELKNKIAIAQFQNIVNMDHSCKGDSTVSEQESQCKLNIIAGHSLSMYQLRPKKELDRSLEPKLHVQDYIKETMDVDGFVGSLEQFRQMVENIRYVKNDLQAEYPKVVFLGTGSCIPSKTRNVSAIVVHVDEQRSLLLDCGEGTFGQLVRFYGPKKVNSFLRTLKGIYISHLHADHHIGLFGVVQARKQAMCEGQSVYPPEPLYLLAPGQFVSWLSTYDQHFEKIRSELTLIPNQALLESSHDKHSAMTPAVLSALGVQSIQMCLVAHCPNAFGVAIQIDEQNKITYSGDTIPCQELVKIGEDSTLLIHEATMEDELETEARIKMHSTTSQAIDIGKKMNARYTVLTHFSQRYARLPRLSQQILNDNHSVGIAFDNMQITMNDLELLPYMYAPLQLMFAEHCVEMELKAEQRARKRERKSSNPNISAVMRNGSRVKIPMIGSLLPIVKHQACYRETNASRLRQESKGMAVGGLVINCRSKSLSPSKKAPIPNMLENVDLPANHKAKAPSSTKGELQSCRNPSRGCSNSTISCRSNTLTNINNSSNDKPKKYTILKPHSPENKAIRNQQIEKSRLGKPITQPSVNKKLTFLKSTKLQQSPRLNQESTLNRINPQIIPMTTFQTSDNTRHYINSANNNKIVTKTCPKSLRQFLEERGSASSNNTFCPQTHKAIQEIINHNWRTSRALIFLSTRKGFLNQKIKASKKMYSKPGVEKPKPVNDLERRQLLLQSKKKLQSKYYWNDSKYERIEGLNWISWR